MAARGRVFTPAVGARWIQVFASTYLIYTPSRLCRVFLFREISFPKDVVVLPPPPLVRVWLVFWRWWTSRRCLSWTIFPFLFLFVYALYFKGRGEEQSFPISIFRAFKILTKCWEIFRCREMARFKKKGVWKVFRSVTKFLRLFRYSSWS